MDAKEGREFGVGGGHRSLVEREVCKREKGHPEPWSASDPLWMSGALPRESPTLHVFRAWQVLRREESRVQGKGLRKGEQLRMGGARKGQEAGRRDQETMQRESVPEDAKLSLGSQDSSFWNILIFVF